MYVLRFVSMSQKLVQLQYKCTHPKHYVCIVVHKAWSKMSSDDGIKMPMVSHINAVANRYTNYAQQPD